MSDSSDSRSLGETRVGPRRLLLWPVHVRTEDHIGTVDDHRTGEHETADRVEEPIALVESNHGAAKDDQRREEKINHRTNCCCGGGRERKGEKRRN